MADAGAGASAPAATSAAPLCAAVEADAPPSAASAGTPAAAAAAPRALPAGVAIRAAAECDVPAIAAIYDASVAGAIASWEYAPPGLEEVRRRYHERVATGYPALVAVASDGGAECVAGFAWVGPFRARVGYRYCVENSIYVAEGYRRRGVGAALLAALIDAAAAAGFRSMVASISVDDGTGEGHASVALHTAAGFTPAGRFAHIGFKFGRWLDAVFLQRPLGEGAASLPDDADLPPPLRAPAA